jgi:hypothetical protein
LEILDDISFNIDGSGTFKYTVNLSSSQVKLNSILALDSIDGKKVPSINEIQEKIEVFAELLSAQEGISNVYIDTNYQQFIFKIQCDFSNVIDLQRGFESSLKETLTQLENEEIAYDWITWDGQVMVRKVPDLDRWSLPSIKTEDSELLKKGYYTSITRFENKVNYFENPAAKLSKNERAVMLRKSAFEVFNDHKVMDNIIHVDSTRN